MSKFRKAVIALVTVTGCLLLALLAVFSVATLLQNFFDEKKRLDDTRTPLIDLSDRQGKIVTLGSVDRISCLFAESALPVKYMSERFPDFAISRSTEVDAKYWSLATIDPKTQFIQISSLKGIYIRRPFRLIPCGRDLSFLNVDSNQVSADTTPPSVAWNNIINNITFFLSGRRSVFCNKTNTPISPTEALRTEACQ